MKTYLIMLVLLMSCLGFGQIKSVVINSKTKQIIPYVNIWVKNENIGTTSNHEGEFHLNIDTSKLIIFSAIGFETLEIKSNSIKNQIELHPKTIELEEVVLNSKKILRERVVGEFRKSKINHYFACGETPWIVARYFDYKKDYKETPFLNGIKVLTNSEVKDAKFNIRFYTVNEKGEPGDYLYSKNTFVVARKGKKINEIDLSNLNLQFPKEGFFIAIEWLIVANNKNEFTFKQKKSRKKFKKVTYEPSIGTVSLKNTENSWIFLQGKWRKLKRNTIADNSHLAIELNLKN